MKIRNMELTEVLVVYRSGKFWERGKRLQFLMAKETVEGFFNYGRRIGFYASEQKRRGRVGKRITYSFFSKDNGEEFMEHLKGMKGEGEIWDFFLLSAD